MKRDMDLVRAILIATEDGKAKPHPEIPGYDVRTTFDHIEVMIERGLVDGVVVHAHDRGSSHVAAAHINRLTWEGHDFLAAARNDTIWNKSKAVFVSKGVPATIELMKVVLMAEAKKALGLP